MKFITMLLSAIAGAMFHKNNLATAGQGTRSRRTAMRNRDGLPSFTPGSKLARKALAGTLTVERGRNF